MVRPIGKIVDRVLNIRLGCGRIEQQMNIFSLPLVRTDQLRIELRCVISRISQFCFIAFVITNTDNYSIVVCLDRLIDRRHFLIFDHCDQVAQIDKRIVISTGPPDLITGRRCCHSHFNNGIRIIYTARRIKGDLGSKARIHIRIDLNSCIKRVTNTLELNSYGFVLAHGYYIVRVVALVIIGTCPYSVEAEWRFGNIHVNLRILLVYMFYTVSRCDHRIKVRQHERIDNNLDIKIIVYQLKSIAMVTHIHLTVVKHTIRSRSLCVQANFTCKNTCLACNSSTVGKLECTYLT